MDFIELYAKQRNEARALFGSTSYNLPGRTDIQYPRLRADYAQRLVSYWRGEATRLGLKVIAPIGGIPDSAHKSAWLRAVSALEAAGPDLTSGFGMLSDQRSKAIWDLLDPVVIPMNALKDTPSRWDLAVESVVDTLKEFGDKLTPSIPTWIKIIAIGGAALWLMDRLDR